MTEINPVYQVQAKEGWGWHDYSEQEYRTMVNFVFATRILYPAAAYESLQKENARLQWEKDNVQRLGVKANEALKAENAAQAKRIEQQAEDNLKQKDLILNFQTQYAKDHAEIESLRKQVEDYEFRFGILKQIDGIKKVIGS